LQGLSSKSTTAGSDGPLTLIGKKCAQDCPSLSVIEHFKSLSNQQIFFEFASGWQINDFLQFLALSSA
jgi:hypothetical protein